MPAPAFPSSHLIHEVDCAPRDADGNVDVGHYLRRPGDYPDLAFAQVGDSIYYTDIENLADHWPLVSPWRYTEAASQRLLPLIDDMNEAVRSSDALLREMDLQPMRTATSRSAVTALSDFSTAQSPIQAKLVGRFYKGESDIKLEVLGPSDLGYAEAVRSLFGFFRKASSGRYTSTTLNRLSRVADDHRNGAGIAYPTIVRVGAPSQYDEETETKTGGVFGVAVVWPATGKTLLSVTDGNRRQGVASLLLALVNYSVVSDEALNLAVHNTNVAAQQFLLRNEFIPTNISTSGVMNFARFGVSPEEAA